MSSTSVNIPISAIQWAFQFNGVEDLRWISIIKATDGRFLERQYPQKVVNRLVRRGWLSKHNDRVYQKKWTEIFPVDGKKTSAKLEISQLENRGKFKLLLFLAGCSYLLQPQERSKERQSSRPLSYNGRKGKIQVKESRHVGGISHSLCMKFFGMSKSWCSAMRKKCSQALLCTWTRRFNKVSAGENDLVMSESVIDEIMDKSGRFRIIAGEIIEEITSQMNLSVSIPICTPFRIKRTS